VVYSHLISCLKFTITEIYTHIFYEANARAPFLEYFDEFTNEDINRICEGVINNNQVYGAFVARRVLRRFVDKYKKL